MSRALEQVKGLVRQPSVSGCNFTISAESACRCRLLTCVTGVCIDESTCKSGGGSVVSNACPGTSNSIKCCTKASCGSTPAFLRGDEQDALIAGNCRWVSDCKGNSVSNRCPGPADFKCCQSSEPGCGGYSQPPRFGEGGCQQVAIKGAKAIIAKFPGRTREVGCKRPSGNKPSDHYNGTATDMMCSDDLNQATMCGQEIAEWARDNRAALDLKYVIWGQRIWSPTRDAVKSWAEWRSQSDLGSVTLNHWVSQQATFVTEAVVLRTLRANRLHRIMFMSAIIADEYSSLKAWCGRPQSIGHVGFVSLKLLWPPSRQDSEAALLCGGVLQSALQGPSLVRDG